MDELRPDGHALEADPFAPPPGAQSAPTPDMPTASATGAVAPPGWYVDPQDTRMQRYWDGTQWQAGQAPAPRPPRKRSLSRGTIAAIVAGAVVIVGGGAAAVALLWPTLEEAAIAAVSGEPTGRPLDATVPTAWSTMPVMDGAGSVAYDPGWEDVSDYVDTGLQEEQAYAETGLDVTVHATWLLEGDIWNGGTSLTIVSLADAGGPSSARLEAQSFMAGVRTELPDVTVTSEGAVRTANGHTGYVIEYETPLYDGTMSSSVGVVVDGPRQVMVYTHGLESTGSGVETMEAVLDSLVLT